MKKNSKNKKKIPAYAFGIDQINTLGSISQLLGTGMQAASDETSNANIAGSTFSGLGTGASAGAMFGPIGAGIGAAIGGIGGLVKGIFNKKAIKEKERKERTAQATQLGLNNAAAVTQDYYANNGLAYTFENGGVLPNLAYLDNNEIVRDVNGNIAKVPNNKPGTDNHLVNSTTLDSVLSDKIKRPGTNRTFAQEGKKLANMSKESKGKDIFAQNSNKLNKINANKAYEALLAEQEAVKAKKGIKPKKKSIPAYEDGKDRKWFQSNSDLTGGKNWYDSFVNTLQDFFTLPPNTGSGRNEALSQAFSQANESYAGLGNTKYWHSNPNSNHTVGNYGKAPSNYRTDWKLPTQEQATDYPEAESVRTVQPVKKSTTKTTNTSKPNLYQAPLWQIESVTDPTLQPVYTGLPEAKMLQLEEMSDPVLQPVDVTNSKGKFNKPNFDLSGNLLELTPTLYNFITGLKKPEYEPTVVNPYSSSIIRSMAKRRANVQPAIEANRRSRAIANYNAANVNANTGMNLALRSQLAANEYAQNADIYANRDNTNNAYLGEYASTLNNLGQQYVQSSTLANDLNARNRAKARDYASSAVSQIGQWAQVKEQMKNQYNRDLMMLPFLSNFLSQGFTQEQVDELVNRTKNRA